MTVADPAAAIAGYLVDQLGDLIGGRAFRPRLPVTENELMPRACVVVTPAGGYQMYGRSQLPIVDPRLYVRCYGETEQQANQIGGEVAAVLRALTRRVSRGALLSSANVTGPLPMIEPDSLWPFSFLSVQALVHEQSVA